MSEENNACNSDACADAKVAIALVVLLVTTVCFFLTGGGKATLMPVFMIVPAVGVGILLSYLVGQMKD